MNSLTDRYVWAVVRSIPEQQRMDIERELRASIDDEVEARTSTGEGDAAAEHAAVAALGDPDRLAASYAQRPNVLISPRYYFDWLRLLKVLYTVVLPIVVVVVVLGNVIAGDAIGQIIGSSVVTAITVGVHLGFWTTLVFVVIERTAPAAQLTEWRPELLPQVPDRRAGAGLGELVSSAVFLLFFAGFLVWQQVSSVFADDAGAPIPVLQPELWSFWIPYVLVLIVLELVFAVALYTRQRWTWALATANVVLNVAFLVPALWLTATDRVLNPEFVERLGWPDAAARPIVVPVLFAVFIGIAAWDVIDGFLKAWRADQAPVSRSAALEHV